VLLLQIRQPDLDERSDPFLEPRLPRERECLLPALARLRGIDPLLQAVVARDQELADLLADIVLAHGSTLPGTRGYPGRMVQFFAVTQVLIVIALISLVLMHSGRDAGMGGLGFTPASQGGTHIVERNLTRVTVVVAILFFANSIALFHYL